MLCQWDKFTAHEAGRSLLTHTASIQPQRSGDAATACFQQVVQPRSASQNLGMKTIDCEIDSIRFAQLLQQSRNENPTSIVVKDNVARYYEAGNEPIKEFYAS